jgi:hypothetical protein
VALVFAVVSLGGAAADIGAVLVVSMVVRVAPCSVESWRIGCRLLRSDLAQAAVQLTVALLLSGAARLGRCSNSEWCLA